MIPSRQKWYLQFAIKRILIPLQTRRNLSFIVNAESGKSEIQRPCMFTYDVPCMGFVIRGTKTTLVKSQYLNSWLTDRQEIWHDDDIGPINYTLSPDTLHLLFCVIKLQKL